MLEFWVAFVCPRQPGPLGLEQRGHSRVVGAQTSSQAEIGENVLDVKKKEDVENWNYFKTPPLTYSCRIQSYIEQHTNLSLTEAELSVSINSHTEVFFF